MKHMLLIFSTISLLFISAHAADVSPRYKLFSFNKVTGLPETNDNFFRVIIDNNIFRPLGWRASPPPFPPTSPSSTLTSSPLGKVFHS